MSRQHRRHPSDENKVAFPQLNKGKNSSTNSLSQFSLGSKVSQEADNGAGGNEEPRIPKINSILSLTGQSQQQPLQQTDPQQLHEQRQEQPYDPDDASAGTWGSDSSEFTSSFEDNDEEYKSLERNEDTVSQQTNTPNGTTTTEQQPWPVFSGFPLAEAKKTRSSNGDVPTMKKLILSTGTLPQPVVAAALVSSSFPQQQENNAKATDSKNLLDSGVGSSDLVQSITTPTKPQQPSSSGSKVVTKDNIASAQKRFFAALSGMGGTCQVLGADVAKVVGTRSSGDNDDDSIHGLDPDSVYSSSKRKQKPKNHVPISIPTKNPDSSSFGNDGKESIETMYFSADDGVDPFAKDGVSDPTTANEMCTTSHAVVSRLDKEIESSYDGSDSFADDDTDFDGDDDDDDDTDDDDESNALHVEFSPSKELHEDFSPTPTAEVDNKESLNSDFKSSLEMQNLAQNFAMEHRIFLKAILELLGQRDKYATEVGMNDPHTIKSGPLKKASHLIKGIWKVKYVEIRRGMFSYYEDALSNTSTNQGELLRKNIPLEANMCTCRAVKLHHKALNLAPGGAIFELTVNQGPKRLWMANSREERGAWINAIHDAMVGGSVARGDPRGKTNGSTSKNSFQRDVKRYMKTHHLIKHAKNKVDYVRALKDLRGLSLYIPIHWLMEQVESEHTGFQEEGIASGVDQLWKDLIRDSVRINGEMFVGRSGHAPERIVGTLMRSIMSCNRKAVAESKISSSAASKYHLTEAQALAYARDVLLSGNRTRSGGDSYYCVDTLCSSPGLVVTVPNSTMAEPVSVTVSKHVDDLSTFYSVHDKSGWLRTRTRWAKPWKKRFFVLSEGTLSFYEKAVPRPHGLQGQIVLVDATIFVKKDEEKSTNGVQKKRFIVTIVAKDGLTLKERERQLLFENEEKFVVWSSTLEGALKHKVGEEPMPSPITVKNVLRRLGHARDDGLSFYGYSLAEKSLKDHAPCLGLDSEAIERQLALYARTSCATVKVSVEASTEYKICTTDPQGDEHEDTWATIRTVYLQDFHISGGPSGRFIRGEELVQVNVVDCLGEQVPPDITPPAPPSPRAGLLSISKGRRLFRHITGDDYEPLDE